MSGAEFANRPGFVRLMNALKPRPPVQVLVMSEESRLGREAIETAYALKQLMTSGVRVFFYLEDRERTLDSPTDKILLSLTAYADELEREKARQRVTDAMTRKAKAGHVTGGRVFGYDNVEVLDASGRRAHVERRINAAEAAVVRRIFELSAAGTGYTRIAKTLNAERVPSPQAASFSRAVVGRLKLTKFRLTRFKLAGLHCAPFFTGLTKEGVCRDCGPYGDRKWVASPAGFEPAVSALKGQRVGPATPWGREAAAR